MSEIQENKSEQVVETKKDTAALKRTSIGGQALMEGVMMRSVNAMAMAVVNPEKEILLEVKRSKGGAKWYRKVPILRGLISFFASLLMSVTTLLRSTEVSSPEEEVPSKGWMMFAVFLGLVLGIGLFIFLPSVLNSLIVDTFLSGSVLISSIVEGLIRIVIFVGYLLLVSLMEDIKRTFMYHGAEHRTINCYEKGLDLTVENVQSCSTRHNRCGTTFLFFVMVLSILFFSIANYIVAQLGVNAEVYGNLGFAFIKLGVRLALLPLVAGVSFELLRALAMLPDNAFTNMLRAPGLALQRLTTYPPDDDMAAVAIKSFMAVHDMDNDKTLCDLTFGEFRYGDVISYIESELAQTDHDDAEVDWIMCEVLSKKRNELREIEKISYKKYLKVKKIVAARKEGKPLWYVLGSCEFYGANIIVREGVLIPRMETEILVEKVIEHIGQNDCSVLDLCTGSGCIAKTIADKTNAKVTASDFSDEALAIAALNFKHTSVELKKSDMFEIFAGSAFDVIVSNPPYIKSDDIKGLQSQVAEYEPLMALDGGADGLDFYKIIAEKAAEYLNDNGALFVEVGFDQAREVAALFETNFKNIEIIKDLQGVERIVKAIRK